MVDAREKYIASQAPRKKRTHPARSAQALNTSGAGIVHREMMDLQRHPNLSGTDVDRLKHLRRDWNRNRKYTDAGMSIAGATTPMGAQDAFRRDTETFRQANPRAYGTMYPLSQGAMKLGEYGGLLGLGVRGLTGQLGKLGQDIKDKLGITGMVDDTIDVQDEYVSDTFGLNQPFYPTDVHPGTDLYYDRPEELEFKVDPNQPYVEPDDYVEEDFGDFYIDEDTLAGPRFDDSGREDYIAASGMNTDLLRQEKLEFMHPEDQRIFEPMTPHIDRETPTKIGVEFGVQDEIPPVPFDDSNREAGIAALYGQGPQWGGTNRRYEDEYRDYVEKIGNMPGGPMTYEEFSESWEDIHQGKPHAGLR